MTGHDAQRNEWRVSSEWEAGADHGDLDARRQAATERGRGVEARIENAHGYERKRAGLSRELRFVRALVVDEPDIALRNTRERGEHEASAQRFKQARSPNCCVCGAIADGGSDEVSGWA